MDQFENSELISAYFDGEVSSAEREEVERLLETSPQWRSQLDQLSQLSEWIREAPRESAPLEVAAAVQRHLNQLPNSPLTVSQTRSLRREWLAAFAGMAVTVVGGFIAMQVMNLNRAPVEQFAAAPRNADFLAEAAASRSPLRSEPSVPTSFAFRDPGAAPQTEDWVGRESRMESAKTDTNDLRSFHDSNSLPAADAPALAFSAPQDRFDYDSDGIKPKDQLRIGDVLTVFENVDGVVFVVELAVVDMNEAGGQLELLLSRNGLDVLPEGNAEGRAIANGILDGKSNLKEAAEDAPARQKLPDTAQLNLMYYVTAPRVTISQVLDELERQPIVAQARLQPPVSAAPQSVLSDNSTEQLEREHELVETPDEAQEALLNEAIFVGQNYGMTQQSAPIPAESVADAGAAKQPGIQNRQQKLRLSEASRRRFGQFDKKSKSAPFDAFETGKIAGNSLTPLHLSNCAVPLTLNPQTGEVTNSFLIAANDRAPGNKSSRAVEAKATAPANSKPVDDSGKADESAPADAAESMLADQVAESPIRVLFVVKQTEPVVVPE